MVYRYKEAVFLLFGILASCQLLAQNTPVSGNGFRTWSVGVNGGISTPFTLLANNSKQDFTSPDFGFGYGLYFKDQLTYSLGLQADFMAGNLKADHSLQLGASNAPIWATSSIKLNWSASISINYTLAHINLHNQVGFLQPYFTLGGGFMSSTPQLRSYFTKTITHPGAANNFFVPLGVGLKFDLTPNINLDLGYQINFVSTDNLDGFRYGSTNDRFSYTHVGLEFSIGNRLKRQLATESRIEAMEAEEVAQEQILRLKIDQQQTALDREKHEVDRLTNDLNITNVQLSKITTDSDGDGIPDLSDKCPNTPPGTKVDATGCPLPPSKPITPVTESKPVTPLPVVVPESQPVTPLPILAEAKPKAPVAVPKPVPSPVPPPKPAAKDAITDGDRSMVNAVIGNITFYTGKYLIREQSFRGLGKVAELVTTKDLYIRLESFTENSGDAAGDLTLAKQRAEAVKETLTRMGVKPQRIETIGVKHPGPKAESEGLFNGKVKAILYKK